MRFVLLIAALLLSATAVAHETSYMITAKVYDGERLVANQSFSVDDRQFSVITFPKDENETFRFSVTGTPKDHNEIMVSVGILLDKKVYSPEFQAKIGEDVKVSIDGMSLEFRIEERPTDAAADREALEALDQAYAAEWIEGDADGVMALFTEDATLVPHHGDTPIVGHGAIRDFWFNPSYSPTVIREWRRTPSEILVHGDMGVVRGRFHLIWEYEGTRTTIPDGNYVLIAVNEEGTWRIRMLTWNDDPREWTVEPAG